MDVNNFYINFLLKADLLEGIHSLLKRNDAKWSAYIIFIM